MSSLVPIEPGQWILSFHQPYGLYDGKTMESRLEEMAFRHWMDGTSADEMFFVMQVQKVMPKTFTVYSSCRYISEGERLYRFNVVAALKTREAALALRDKLFGIGEDVGDRIEKEMYRRIERYSEREQAKGLKRVRRCLPEFFGRGK
ncbi:MULTISPECIES: hypothetical protein [Rhizobium/Agrobacterium group]|uniref:hypothetical protein n=1 Tax=Rhizobium/Agrobacterium group TaxID=227290 RepID=UPI0017D4C96C|nr:MULTISPECIES: hypothetical protein [Rhizobium/Agrobacterium group]MBB4402560.1 hypothetical protein [Agrobacterium radiobacter]MBB5588714.1 hypothetical protein [Agrobacterium radiobacter]